MLKLISEKAIKFLAGSHFFFLFFFGHPNWGCSIEAVSNWWHPQLRLCRIDDINSKALLMECVSKPYTLNPKP
jgi:hypothetical protein